MLTSDCSKCARHEKMQSRGGNRKSVPKTGEYSASTNDRRLELQSRQRASGVPRETDPMPSVMHYQFSRLLRNNHVSLPSSLAEPQGGFEAAYLREYPRLSGLNTGKVKVIVCVRQAEATVDYGLARSFPATEGQVSPPNQCMGALSNLTYSIPAGCVTVGCRRNQLTLMDPTPPLRRRASASNPRLFTFDAILTTQQHHLIALCTAALVDVIQQVLRGQDGCILTLGHRHTGKTRSMLGSDTSSPIGLGIIPCAISWLFQVLNQQKELTGIRFSVRVSAVALNGLNEEFCDLLEDAALSHDEDTSPSQYLQSTVEDPNTDALFGDSESVAMQMRRYLANQKEIRVSNAEKAAHLLDIALNKRATICTSSTAGSNTNTSGLSHMLFTFHIYQCRVEQSDTGAQVSGGRTRLHLLDLGCGRYGHQTSSNASAVESVMFKKVAQKMDQPLGTRRSMGKAPEANSKSDVPNPKNNTSRSLSISGMANVLLALLTGQRHLPFRDSALTHLIKEAMTGTQMHPCVLVHVDSGAQYYAETLQVLQLASKLSRLRRRRVGPSASIPAHLTLSSCTEDTGSSMDSYSDSGQTGVYRRRLRGPRMGKSSYARSYNSDVDFTSSSEQSCETVIYMGRKYGTDRLETDQLDHSAMLRLGPRGAADGSVDMRSISSGQLSSGEQQNRTLTRNSDPATLKKNATLAGSSTRSVKRMIPRTNATVWPRALSPNLKEALLSQEETWIDGPKALGTVLTSSQSSTARIRSSGPQWSQPGYPSTPVSSPTHSVMQPTTFSTDAETVFCPLISTSTAMCTPQYPQNSSWHGGHTVAQEQNQHQSAGTSNCSTLEHGTNIGLRALSDISERTEETETAPDGNTVKSSSTGPLFDRLQLFKLDELSHLDDFCLNTGVIPHNNELMEGAFTNARERGETATIRDAQVHPCKGENFDQDTNGKVLSTYDLEMCLSLLDKAPSLNFGDMLNPKTPESIHRLGYSPIKSLNTNAHSVGEGSSTEHSSYINGCGEKLLTVDDSESVRTTLTGKRWNCVQDIIAPKDQHLQSLNYLNECSRCPPCEPQQLPEIFTGKCKEQQKQQNQLPASSANNSLSRVAAWVDSIINLSNPVPITVPCDIPSVPQNHETTAQAQSSRTSAAPRQTETDESKPNQNSHCPQFTGFESSSRGYAQGSHLYRATPHAHNFHPQQFPRVPLEASINRTSENPITPEPSDSIFPRRMTYDPRTANLPANPLTPTLRSPCQRMQPYNPLSNKLQHKIPDSTTQTQGVPEHLDVNPLVLHWDALQADSFSLPRARPTGYATEHLRKATTYIPTNDQFQSHEQLAVGKDRYLTDHSINREKELLPATKTKNSKVLRSFRFPTLPIFRSFRLRKERKKAKEQAAKILPDMSENVSAQYSGAFETVAGTDFSRSPAHITEFRERCHSCSPVPSPLCSIRTCTSLFPQMTRFERTGEHMQVTSPRQMAMPTSFQPCATAGVNATEFMYRSMSSGPALDVKATSSPMSKQQSTKEAIKLQERSYSLVQNNRPGILPTPQFVHQLESTQIHLGLPNSPSAPLNSPHYPGTVFTPVYRSGRRSVNGGPASSGYESMHIGTSELSLSHPDSASECSGILPPNGGSKEMVKSRLFDETNRYRRHSSTTGSRASGSAGSGVSCRSPMHSSKAVEPLPPNSDRMGHWRSSTPVSSFLKLKHQHPCR